MYMAKNPSANAWYTLTICAVFTGAHPFLKNV